MDMDMDVGGMLIQTKMVCDNVKHYCNALRLCAWNSSTTSETEGDAMDAVRK